MRVLIVVIRVNLRVPILSVCNKKRLKGFKNWRTANHLADKLQVIGQERNISQVKNPLKLGEVIRLIKNWGMSMTVFRFPLVRGDYFAIGEAIWD